MSASNVVDFFVFFSNLLKFTGYQFFTHISKKNGGVLQSFKILDVLIFIISVGYSISYAFFGTFEVNIQPLLNSSVMQILANMNINFGMYSLIVFKILPLCIHRDFIRIVQKVQLCFYFVSITLIRKKKLTFTF